MKNYKKYIGLILFFAVALIIFTPNVMALDYNNLCSDGGIRKAFKIIGYLVMIAKWIVPLIIIVLGMMDYFKASISNDEHALSKATIALIKRIIAGIVVFFIPTIILAGLNLIQVTGNIENEEFGACTKCIFDPNGSC